jgi:hypothetical protein
VENEATSVEGGGKQKANGGKLQFADEGRKRVLLLAASIIAARRLAQERVNDSPRTRFAISESVAWADRIMREIDRKWPTKP